MSSRTFGRLFKLDRNLFARFHGSRVNLESGLEHLCRAVNGRTS